MEGILNSNQFFCDLNTYELFEIDGGVDWIVFVGGCIAVGISVVAVVAAAVVGGIAGGPAGAVIGAGAASKAVLPFAIGGVAAMALGARY